MIELDADQMAIVKKYTTYARNNIKVLNEDQVVRICVDGDFNEQVIDKEL